jgi:hypothetical protein
MKPERDALLARFCSNSMMTPPSCLNLRQMVDATEGPLIHSQSRSLLLVSAIVSTYVAVLDRVDKLYPTALART